MSDLYESFCITEALQLFVLDGIKELKWLNGKTLGFTEDEKEDIISDLKEHFEDSVWYNGDASVRDTVPFDDWYDWFSEDILPQCIN